MLFRSLVHIHVQFYLFIRSPGCPNFLSVLGLSGETEELARVITEAEKFHNVPSVSWRPTNARGVIPSESVGKLMV